MLSVESHCQLCLGNAINRHCADATGPVANDIFHLLININTQHKTVSTIDTVLNIFIYLEIDVKSLFALCKINKNAYLLNYQAEKIDSAVLLMRFTDKPYRRKNDL